LLSVTKAIEEPRFEPTGAIPATLAARAASGSGRKGC
jgi:hypothetical protein